MSMSFFQNTSLRKKIILPFILIMIITSIIFMVISIHFISKNIEKKINSDLEKQSLAIKQSLNERLKKSIFYAQLISDMRKIVDPIANPKVVTEVKNVFLGLVNQDRTKVYLSLNDFPPEKKIEYKNLLIAGFKGQTKVNLYLDKSANNDLTAVAVAVAAVKKNGQYYPSFTSYKFDNNLLADTKSKFRSDLTLISEKGSNPQILATTINNKESQKILDLFKKLGKNLDPEQINRNIFDLKFKKQNYKIMFQQMDLNPNIYLAILSKADELSSAKESIIMTAILGFSLIILVMMLIYFFIIRKITKSIDILIEGIKKVSEGNLDHQVNVKTHDEIGKLANFFNQMILNLKESRQNLLTEKERSEAIIANIPEGIIVTDQENRLILANQKAEKMFNFSLAETEGKFILECINNPELLETIKEQLMHPSKIFAKEITMSNDKEKPQYFILTFSLAQNKANDFIGVITVLRDITHDKELEELRDSFLRTVSHELRTPLTSIIGFIDLILQGIAGGVNKQQNDYLTISLKQAIYLKDLINNLLDLSKIEAGKVRMIYSEIDVATLIKEVVKSLEPVVLEKKEKIQIIIKPTTAVIVADIEKIRRILINLITNAIKFTQEGNIVVDCKEDDGYALFSIKDTGIGLSPEECEIIFDKFFQVDSSSTRSYEGLGLGLPIAKELVELHKGKIWVESAYMKGSDFKFTIPKEPRVK